MLHLYTFLNTYFKAVCLGLALLIINQSYSQDILTGFTSNGGPQGRGTLFSLTGTGTNFSVIKGFSDWGITPDGSLLQGDDGNFYGMTSDGGTYTHAGAIFVMSPSGAIRILKQFNSTTEGAYAHGELIKGTDGSFYGMCSAGGANTYGTIFKITTGGVFTLLKTFAFVTDGSNPRGHLVQAKDGNFYGITYGGGANGYGTIFKMTPAGAFTVLRSLNKATDGGNCYGSLTEGKDGNLYGITYSGGTLGYGTIFKITTSGVFTVLRNLNSTTDGAYSQSDLIQATDGNFYGMSYSGGTYGNGTIFKITTAGVLTVIKHLASAKDGGSPYGNLFQHTDGNLYGMTRTGTAGNAGGIFKITLAGVYTQLHSFVAATEGTTPNGGLVQGKDGNLYGVASAGGTLRGGTAFKITTTGAFTLLASFPGSAIGNAPLETPVKGSDSAYYGLNSTGGLYGYGTVVKVCGNATTVLFSFNRTANGAFPKGSLVRATDGNFYGITTDGGTNSAGTIFKITPAGVFTVLRHLVPATDGAGAQGSLIQAKDGFLYGMTNSGGAKSGGTIFKISLTGVFTVLKSLAYATDGANPEGSLLQVNDSTFYGLIANGSKAFKITTSGNFSIVHTFLSSNEGSYPLGSLITGKDGLLYGTNSSGGLYNGGTVFKMTLAGVVTVLRHLNPVPDGKISKGNLLLGSDGSLYGMTSAGGTYGSGTIFKITTANAFSVLKHFNLTSDGGAPFGSLILAPKNNLVANAQSITLSEDTQKTITLTGTGGSPLTYTINSLPKSGTLTGTGNIKTYAPARNFNGTDQFGFSVSVGCLSSPVAVVSITVSPAADTPVLATIGSKTIAINKPLTFTATATDADAGQVLKYSLINAPTGAAINTTTGAFSWTPSATGTYSFKVRVTDNGIPALYDEELVSVTVTATFAPLMMKPAETLNTEAQQLNLYPNPVTGLFYITADFPEEDIIVSILNTNGTILSTGKYHPGAKGRIQLNGSGLKPGSYILVVSNGWKKQSVKFIRN